MAKLTLYHAAPSRSSITRWMLEEIGEPYDIHLLSLNKGDNRAPEFLAVNPMGKVPALKHGDVVITEAAAICAYLADEFPRAKLNVPVGDPRRGVYLKWLFFGPSCIEPAIIDRAAPRKEEARRGMLGYGDFDTVMDVVAKAVSKGPYLLGEQFTAADVVIGSGLRWGMLFKLLPERPEFLAYVGRLAARPALQRAEAQTRSLQRRKQRAPRCSAGKSQGIFSRISLAPHSGYARVQMILALRILHFEDLSVGMTETLSKIIASSDVVGFAQLTGDRNPIHLSEHFAAKTQFGKRIAHGLYTASLISAVLGTRLPGPGAVYISQTLNFRAPVRIGDQVDVTVTVAELIPERQRARLTCTCTVADEVVLDGEALVKVPSAAKSKRPLPRI